MGKGSKRRPRQISVEEDNFRWEYAQSENKMPLDEFNKRIAEIRKRTGKP